MEEAERKKRRDVLLLIGLCWAVYACSYLGKLNYAANINPIMAHYGVSHAQAGLVTSYFSVSYAVGQVVNGIFCKRYPLRQVVFAALTVSAGVNLCMALGPAFETIRFLWMVNGFATSLLWPCLVRLLSETLAVKDMGKAVVAMGTTTATGTFAIYGISAGFALFDGFRWVFALAACVLTGAALVWLLISGKRIAAAKDAERREAADGSAALDASTDKRRALLLCVVVLALYGVAVNLLKDGLTGWVPSILKEGYGLGDSLSILLTLALPMVSMFGSVFSVRLHKRIPDFAVSCAVLFGVSGLGMMGVLAGMKGGVLWLAMAGFGAVCFLMATGNSVITSMFPMLMKGKLNSGMLAGVLNGFCYVGSTVSAVGLGAVADHFGWSAVFTVLTAVCIGCAVLALPYVVLKHFLEKRS